MGWVSYLEDKLDRLNSDLEQIKKHRDPRGKRKLATSEDENRLHALIRVCERFVRDINRHLEIATDPELNLADELLQLRNENQVLREKVKVLDDTQSSLTQIVQRCSQLQKDFDRANRRASKHYAQLEELSRRHKKLEKEHSRIKRGKGLH